jgi:hypothetical protein
MASGRTCRDARSRLLIVGLLRYIRNVNTSVPRDDLVGIVSVVACRPKLLRFIRNLLSASDNECLDGQRLIAGVFYVILRLVLLYSEYYVGVGAISVVLHGIPKQQSAPCVLAVDYYCHTWNLICFYFSVLVLEGPEKITKNSAGITLWFFPQ